MLPPKGVLIKLRFDAERYHYANRCRPLKFNNMRRALVYLLLVSAVAVAGAAYYFISQRAPVTPPLVTPVKPSPPVVTPDTGGTCVACHRNVPILVGHSFADWENSSHARSGISCQHCHGGDASQPTVEPAHQNVRSSRDLQSPLYFTQIPKTCGTCHSAELELFRQSIHFAKLQETGQGPNCITCHGAMATVILKPVELEATCSACHNPRLGILPDEPLKARFVLALMLQAQEHLHLTGKLIELRKPQIDTAPAEALLAQAREAMKQVNQAWHTFRAERVEALVEQALERAREAVRRLDVEK